MKGVFKDTWLLLTFRLSREQFNNFGPKHLYFGLFCTWIAGMGRYWDDPRAIWPQHLGVGSVLYVFVLSLVLFLLLWRLDTECDWDYKRVLTYVTLVSPPAILYAIPVERFMGVDAARSANVWFLAIVASWRVLLLLRLFVAQAGLKVWEAIVVTLLPIAGIVVALVILNLQHVVFDIMGGLRDKTNPHDSAYSVVLGMSILGVVLFIPLIMAYAWMVFEHNQKDR